VTRAFVPQMRQRGAGRIVNISSILGRFALPGTGPYSASKFAVEACSDALRMELAPYDVPVVLVEPGVTDTSLYQAASTALPGYQEALEPYRSTWAGGFDFPRRLLQSAATADSVAAEVVRAALASHPRPRYQPGVRTRLRTRLLTALPHARGRPHQTASRRRGRNRAGAVTDRRWTTPVAESRLLVSLHLRPGAERRGDRMAPTGW
jgi:hypothetical protein